MKKIITITFVALFATTLLAQVPNGAYVPKNDVAKALHYAKFDFIGGNKVKGYIGINGEPLGVVYDYIYTLNGKTLSLSEEGKNGSVELTYDKTNDEIILLDELFGTEGAVWRNDGTKYKTTENQNSTVPVQKEPTQSSGKSLNGFYVPVNEISKGLHYAKFDFISSNKVKGYIGMNGQSLGVAYEYTYTLNGTTLSLSEAGQNGSVEFSYDSSKDQILLSTGNDACPAAWGKEGLNDCCFLSAPQVIDAPKTVISGSIYTLSWKQSECATRYIVYWSFYKNDGTKKHEGNSGWTEKLEWSFEVPDESGIMYINIYAGDAYKGGEHTPDISVDVRTPIVFVPGTMGCWRADEFEDIIQYPYYESISNSFSNSTNMGKSFYEIYENEGFKDASLLSIVQLFFDNGYQKIPKANYYSTEIKNKNESLIGKYYIDPIMDSFVDFFEALKNKEYKKDRDYFIFGYDTFRDDMRRVSGENLKKYVEYVFYKTGAKKVRIVAHSQGNLVARTYIELLGGYENVEKFIMVAPPNKGVDVMEDLYYNGIDPLSYTNINIKKIKGSFFSWVRELMVAFFTWRSPNEEGGLNRARQEVTNDDMANLLQTRGRAVEGMLPKESTLQELNKYDNVQNLLEVPVIVIIRAKNVENSKNTVIGHKGDKGVDPNFGEGDGTVAFESNIIDSEKIKYKTFSSLRDIHSDLFKKDDDNSLSSIFKFQINTSNMKMYRTDKGLNSYTHILYELGLYSTDDQNEKRQLESYENTSNSIGTKSVTITTTSQKQHKNADASNDMPVQNTADISTNSNTANPITTSSNTLTPTDQKQQSENTPAQVNHEPTSNSITSSGNPVVQELVTCKTQRQVQLIARQSGLVIGRNTSKGFAYPEKCMIAVFSKNGALEALLDVGGNIRTDLLSGSTVQNPEQFYNREQYSLWYMQQK